MQKNNFLNWLSLFASTGTIFCCALPALLVVLGLGGSFASLLGVFPQLVWLSSHKEMVFMVSGSLILISSVAYYKGRNDPCPIDPEMARACESARRWSFWILLLSGCLWVIGAFFAFLAPLILI